MLVLGEEVNPMFLAKSLFSGACSGRKKNFQPTQLPPHFQHLGTELFEEAGEDGLSESCRFWNSKKPADWKIHENGRKVFSIHATVDSYNTKCKIPLFN